ncbi:MAG: MFS transporter [Nitrospirota bacterium]
MTLFRPPPYLAAVQEPVTSTSDARDILVLRAFYFSVFAALGVLLPYFNLFLARRGFSAAEIGLLAAIIPVCKTIIPPFWARAADRRANRKGLALVAAAGALAAGAMLALPSGFAAMAAVLLVFAAFWTAHHPLVEVTVLESLDRSGSDYGRVRLWGSIGFIVLVVATGIAIDLRSTDAVVPILTAILLSNLLLTFVTPRGDAPPQDGGDGLRGLLADPAYRRIVIAGLLMQLSHGTYYGFFTIYLDGVGFSKSVVGLLWGTGVAAEILVMFASGWMIDRLGVRAVLGASLALAAARWALTASTLSLPLLFLAQTLHAFSFGAFHVASILHVYRIVPERLRTMGQVVYGSLSFGIGIGVGQVVNGFFYESAGAPMLFALSAAAALIGLAVWVRFPRS